MKSSFNMQDGRVDSRYKHKRLENVKLIYTNKNNNNNQTSQ